MRKVLLTTLTLLLLTGCHHWRNHDATGRSLKMEWELAQARVDLLALKGAKACLPAHLKELQSWSLRTRQATKDSGYVADANNDLIVLRERITKLEKRLAQLQEQDECQPPPSGENLPPLTAPPVEQ